MQIRLSALRDGEGVDVNLEVVTADRLNTQTLTTLKNKQIMTQAIRLFESLICPPVSLSYSFSSILVFVLIRASHKSFFLQSGISISVPSPSFFF